MKIWNVEFDGMWGVPHGLIISAKTRDEAWDKAVELVTWCIIPSEAITEVKIDNDEPTVIFFESGDY